MPLVAMAVKMPCTPVGANPWELKFWPWKAATKNETITRRMMNSFHPTSALLIRANQRTPK